MAYGSKDLRGERYIDSRDLLKRLEELRGDRDDEEIGLTEDEAEELKAIEAIEDELPSDGETLVREDQFEDYARELAADIGSIKGDESWPLNCIDWEKAARELQMDYTSIEFGDYTYLMRSC